MSISINTDMMSMKTFGVLERATNSIQSSMKSLSTGVKLNSAADGAADLALSKSLSSRTSGINVANNNIQTGITKLQTLDGDLSIITDSLHRLRDLSVQAANGVYSSDERALIDREAQQILEELNVAEKKSNDHMVSDTLAVHVGENSDSYLEFTGMNVDFATTISIDMTTETDSRNTLQELDNAINYISEKRSQVGSNMNLLETKLGINNTRSQELTATVSSITDTDMAAEASEITKNQIWQQSSISLMQQSSQLRASSILSLI